MKLSELEKLLGTFSLNELQGPAEILHAQMMALNYVPSSYDRIIPDPGYEERIELKDATLPDNTKLRRLNYANDALHNQMVNQQYEGK